MMQLKVCNMVFYLSFVLAFSCSTATIKNENVPVVISNDSGKEVTIDDTMIIDNSSGVYGIDYCDLFLIFKNNSVKGYYFYFDGWDEKSKQYEQQCIFSFKSDEKLNDSTYTIIANNYNNVLHGKLILTKLKTGMPKINLSLEEQPDGYAAYDFEDGYNSALMKKKDWVDLAVVNKEKVYFYNSPNESDKSTEYIVENEIVAIISDVNSNWFKIEYITPSDTDKSFVNYIKKEDLRIL